MSQERITQSLQQHTALLETFVRDQGAELERLAQVLVASFHAGGRLFVLGSGQFAAVANLVASLFNFRLSLERPQLPAISLSHDPLLALALAREEQAGQYFSRQLRTLGRRGDVVLALCGVPRDEAVEEALAMARQNGNPVAVFFHGREEEYFGERPDHFFLLETESLASALEAALFCGRLACELVEAELFGL
ncbi:D-sedoheptulose-7-phosphate isomerase [Geoalkalibacter halelectricus]|uniref:SIS domain-containing protein n=1 Tax=Geoalkalibacter halelectricus TaxID=2847045 RepID=A0ABY5ZJ09_9BACT|nr:SIS domain-containing protein [Geoalkalibacter halelectricus]MDO3377887.1 SIS domain-containing protein [Geoalkalibacter halelectricus]UWZ77930.1 SIS domain-containing protein [Geoalkalibacter halelectricus]